MAEDDRDKDIRLRTLSISDPNDADLELLQEIDEHLVALDTRPLADEAVRERLRSLDDSWRDQNVQRLEELAESARLLSDIAAQAARNPRPEVLRMLATGCRRASVSACVALATEAAIAAAERKLREKA
jgi:hypothetical protein